MSLRGGARKRGHQHHPRNKTDRKRPALVPVVLQQPEYSEFDNSDAKFEVREPELLEINDPVSNACGRVDDVVEIKDAAVKPQDVRETSKHPKDKSQQNHKNTGETNNVNKYSKDKSSRRHADNSKSAKDENVKPVEHTEIAKIPHSNADSEGTMVRCENKLDVRPPAEGRSQSDDEFEDDETKFLSKLTCNSESTEEVLEKQARRKRRCVDYPGLAFGNSIFTSDVLMKFSIIRNELQNISKTLLRRAQLEVESLKDRVKTFDDGLENSRVTLDSARSCLSELLVYESEQKQSGTSIDDLLDDTLGDFEIRLMQTKLIVEDAERRYEEAIRKLVGLGTRPPGP